jgi:hypothetical protein
LIGMALNSCKNSKPADESLVPVSNPNIDAE